MYQIKSNYEVKDIDKGVLTAYVSIFNNIDSDGDKIMPGAFAKTIKERGAEGSKRIKHLWQHDAFNVIGVPVEMKEDETGLLVRSKFGTDQNSQEKLQQHLDGLITEFSIGYNVIKEERVDETINGDDIKFNKLLELKLWEYSSVTWGANSLTHVVDAKGTRENVLEWANDRMQKLVKALRNGKYTDETCEQFEIELKQIQGIYNELIAEPAQSTPQEPSEDTQINDIKEIFNNFKIY